MARQALTPGLVVVRLGLAAGGAVGHGPLGPAEYEHRPAKTDVPAGGSLGSEPRRGLVAVGFFGLSLAGVRVRVRVRVRAGAGALGEYGWQVGQGSQGRAAGVVVQDRRAGQCSERGPDLLGRGGVAAVRDHLDRAVRGGMAGGVEHGPVPQAISEVAADLRGVR